LKRISNIRAAIITVRNTVVISVGAAITLYHRAWRGIRTLIADIQHAIAVIVVVTNIADAVAV
jgi:hypothetical protein